MEARDPVRPGGQAQRPQSLQEALDYARSIVDTVRAPLLVLDANLRVATANRYFYQAFRTTPDQTEDRLVFELGDGQWDVPALRRLLEEVLPANRTFDDFRVEHVFPHIGRRVILLNARLLATEGQPARILLAIEDITERETLVAQLRHKATELQEADRRKNEFLAMLAHELRNPLGPVLAAVGLLARHDVMPESAIRAREVIGRQVLQMARMVDDLLDVSRISRGKIKLKKAVVELHDVIERAVEMSRHHADDRQHPLLLSLPPRPLLLEADPARLQQAVANLLNNAAKYTEPGGKITLIAEHVGDWAVLTVEDTGQGIARDFLPQIFDLFAQEDRSLDRAAGGLGIGLTLVKSIVELHGGSIVAQSQGPGKGSTFILRLPALDKVDSDKAAEPDAEPVAAPAAPGVLGPRRVLVVDDQDDVVEMLAELLRLDGHEVRVAHDGPVALDAARTFRPDVVLLDIGLPGMDGYEVARQLRKMHQTENALLVAVTGYGRTVDRRRGQKAGFDHHLVKPVSMERVEEVLRATCPGDAAVGRPSS